MFKVLFPAWRARRTDGGKLFLRASQQTLPVDDDEEEEQEVAEASGQKHSLKAVSKGRMRHRPSHRLLGCSELATFEDDEDESGKQKIEHTDLMLLSV